MRTNEFLGQFLAKGRASMETQTIDIYYNFEKSEDVTDKCDPFVEKFEELDSLAKRLQNIVHEETAKSKGRLIEEITDSIDEHVNYSQLYYDAIENSMENASTSYNKLINKIKAHDITVHYRVIEMNPSKIE